MNFNKTVLQLLSSFSALRMYQAPNNSSTGGVHQPPSNQMPSPGANAPTSMPAPAEHVSVGSGGTPVMMVAPSYNQPPQV